MKNNLGKSWCILAITLSGFAVGSALSVENGIDFEDVSQELRGWSATAPDANNKLEYRIAAKWDKPFSFVIESEKPHSGSSALKIDVTEEIPGMLSFGPAVIPATGEVEIRFYVRNQGLNEEGMLSFDEYDSGNKRINPKWAAAKIPLSEEWTEVSWTGRFQEAAAGVRLRFIFKSVPAGAKIWIDDILVKSVGN